MKIININNPLVKLASPIDHIEKLKKAKQALQGNPAYPKNNITENNDKVVDQYIQKMETQKQNLQPKINSLQNIMTQLDDNKKYILSTTDKVNITTTQQQIGMKPKGVWYACGLDWMNFIVEQYATGLNNVNFILEISPNENNMIIINNENQFVNFHNNFNAIKDTKNSNDLDLIKNSVIDWEKVAQEFSGVQICPYQYEMRIDYLWYYTWDVASGCIWNQSAVQSSNIIASFDQNKQEFIMK